MTYEQTIDYLFTRLPMFSKSGADAIKADLTNTLVLCERLGNPQHKLSFIHVAGTNGKGSTSHMLSAIFQQAGYKTGLYTSPHLKDFRERIRINGCKIPEKEVIDFVEFIEPTIEEIRPSFFEITVAMAMSYFNKEKVDIAIIEVGLGGRLDSTNIITPILSVITNIGMDHMDILGDSIEKIALEKAGIIKKGIPVVIGEWNEKTYSIFKEKAAEYKAPINFADQNMQVDSWIQHDNFLDVRVRSKNETSLRQYRLDLPGIYQLKNLLTVLEAIKQLVIPGWKIREEDITTALTQVKSLTGLHGRWEKTRDKPTVIIDVAHNVDGISQLIKHLATLSYNKLHIVIGLVKDKDISSILNLLPKAANYYFTNAKIPRALEAAVLLEKAGAYNLTGTSFDDVQNAVDTAIGKANDDDLILVCGSVFVAGEVRNYE